MFAQDFVEPYDAPEPDGCNCEQALQATCDRLKADLATLRDELVSLHQADRDAAKMAQEVIQAVTLEEAKQKARVYLGLATPF